MKRIRFQQGSLRLYERAGGDRAWEYRWYETQIDGTRRRRSTFIGTFREFPTEAAAQKAVAALRANINAETPRTQIEAISFSTLSQHYREKELCEGGTKTLATIRTNEGYLDRWILPRWSSYRLKDVKAVIVEEWLKSLPLANGSKAKIRNLMHVIFNHAIRWEWHDRNPITHVRQSAKRQKVPAVLSIEQLKALVEQLKEPGKTAVLLDILTGLRVSELLALKWSDVDFENLELHVTRSIALQRVGPCKTEASQKPVPLDPELAEVLLMWRRQSAYPLDEDWVFASPASKGKLPYWSFSIFRVYIKPALKAARITGKVGWHTFRHSFATILKSHGEDVKTVQELLRHANSSITLNLYAQAVTDTKRTAQSKIARLVFDSGKPLEH
ncbi:MAG TPA: site-specific integrase [Acidobacteriaceae bacterium]|nr:site-specific integrase [Acidobacteriaceae bacterium]